MRATESLYTKIQRDDSLMETLDRGNNEYPFYYYMEDMSQFDFNCVDWHWHKEFEFVWIKKGDVTFYIGDEQLTLHEDQAIMMNSKVLHEMKSVESAIIPNFLFNPELLAAPESALYDKYITPILNSTMNYVVFDNSELWREEILSIIKEIDNGYENRTMNEITTSSLLLKLWSILADNIDLSEYPPRANSEIEVEARLQIMMQYIHANYSSSISLEEIATSANIGKSSALNYFGRILHTSPVNYLIDYRLKQAAQMLLSTSTTISQIAEQSGFDNVGYFCRKFKTIYGMTPTEYRKK